LLEQFDESYTPVIDSYAKLIENKEGSKIMKYNRESLYIEETFW